MALLELDGERAKLAARYPGWRVWRTDSTWYATRLGRAYREPATLAADTLAELDMALGEAEGS